jgi:hypothetical protein
MNDAKWNRRLQNLYWSFCHLSRKVGSGSPRQADRAARLNADLRRWLSDNRPQNARSGGAVQVIDHDKQKTETAKAEARN